MDRDMQGINGAKLVVFQDWQATDSLLAVPEQSSRTDWRVPLQENLR
jgi:hypothetical protein